MEWESFLTRTSGGNLAHRCLGKLGLCGSDREKLLPIGMEREGQRMAYSGKGAPGTR